MDNKIHIMSEKFINEKTGENITGITIMIDGKLKQVLDILIDKNGGNKDYTEIVHDVLIAGIDNYIKKCKEEKT